jgi:hypothetical protein
MTTVPNQPDLCHLLGRDCLEEVCSQVSASDLLSLRQACNGFAKLLKQSEKVWVRKLEEDFGLALKVGCAPVRRAAGP